MEREIDYGLDLKFVPHYKTGIKLLDIQQLENMFPNCTRLLERIEDHRRELGQMGESYFVKDSQYNLMYDNIFSIFGKRGAGKTSAMFTLRKILKTQHPYDVVLPIIMPEMIPQECSMIGWILSLLEETVDELEQKMRGKEQRNWEDFEECMHYPNNSLRKEYEKVKELCFSQFYQSEGAESFSTVLINKERQAQNSFNFSKRLGKFWDMLTKTIKITSPSSKADEPLIYIIFDDVDLLPEAVTTLLSTIIKYLSHPNIIVFVTADEELLYDVIENNMNEKLRKHSEIEMYSNVIKALSDSEAHGTGVPASYFQEVQQKIEMSRQIPRLYADKVLPPSSRYYLKTYETFEDKSMFIERVEPGQDNPGKRNRLLTLEEVFKREITRYIEAVGSSKENFLEYDGEFIKAYFAFWGNTSRQLANEALILHEFITRLIENDRSYKNNRYSNHEKYLKILHETICDFAYDSLIAMGSSGVNGEEVKTLIEELIVCNTGKWEIYLNYSYLREHLEEGIQENNNPVKVVRQTVCLCVLLFFLENILIIESSTNSERKGNKRDAIHGRGILVDILDQVTIMSDSLVCKNQAKDVNEFLKVYEKILVSPETLMEFDLMDPRTVRNYLNKISDVDVDDNIDMGKQLTKYSRENPKWLKSITKILYFSNVGIYEIQKREMIIRKLNNPTYTVHDSYYESSLKELRDDLVTALCGIPEEFDKDWKNVIHKKLENDEDLGGNTKNLKKVDEEVRKKIYGNKDQKIGFVREEVYLKIKDKKESKAERTLTLLEELEVTCDELLDNYSALKYYKITNIEEFNKLISNLEDYEINVLKKIKLENEETPDSEKVDPESSKILVSDMNKIFTDISEELEKLSSNIYSPTYRYRAELEDIYTRLSSCISMDLKSEEDVKRAIDIVIGTQQFKTLQKYYLWSYLEMRKEKPKDMRIDYTMLPYKNLYIKLFEVLKEDKKNKKSNGTYLSKLLRRYIEEAVAQYVDKLMEG